MQTINENDTPLTATDWLSAKDVMKRAVLHLGRITAPITIATRAHAGLIKARAQLVKWEYETNIPYGRNNNTEQPAENYILPKEFWWAEGYAALKQNWLTGDFSTWIDHKYHWQAFGVEFDRAGIEAMLPQGHEKEDKAEVKDTRRASPVKNGYPPSNEKIIAKAYEMKVKGMTGYEIASNMRKEHGFENVATTEVRALIKGHFKSGRKPKQPAH
jgi:hypothetical protein